MDKRREFESELEVVRDAVQRMKQISAYPERAAQNGGRITAHSRPTELPAAVGLKLWR
jgi:hypothetical protein